MELQFHNIFSKSDFQNHCKIQEKKSINYLSTPPSKHCNAPNFITIENLTLHLFQTRVNLEFEKIDDVEVTIDEMRCKKFLPYIICSIITN